MAMKRPRLVIAAVCLVIASIFLVFSHNISVFNILHKDTSTIQNEVMSVKRAPAVMYYDNITDDKERIIATARNITSNSDLLIVSFINNAYVPFANSWLCNTKYMSIHKHLLIIAADLQTLQQLRKNHPHIRSVAITGFNVKGDQTYTHSGYVRIGIRRTIVLNWLLQSNFEIFLMEFDCLWVRNPVQEMLRHRDHDLVILPVHSIQKDLVAIGFYYMFPTDRMKSMWNELCNRLTVLDNKLVKMKPGDIISEEDNDQKYLIKLVKEKYANVKVKILPIEQFPDGTWYKGKNPHTKLNTTNIFIVNNNFIQGNGAKIHRAKQFGHWFVKQDGVTCDENAIKNVVGL